MLLWIEAVTDRSQNDVYRVLELLEKGWKNFTDSEKREWSAGMKGSLNISDLTRIQNNIQLLSDVLELNLTVSDVPEIPTVTLFDEIRENTGKIRSAYCIHSTTPTVPEEPVNTFEKWTDIEKILSDVYEILLNNFHYYCGTEIYAGESSGLLL